MHDSPISIRLPVQFPTRHASGHLCLPAASGDLLRGVDQLQDNTGQKIE